MNPRPLYDAAALVPHLEMGGVVLTPNRRLARYIRQDWDRRMAARGNVAWPTAEIHAAESWLLAQWEKAVTCGVLPGRRQLSAAQTDYLWQKVIEDHAALVDGFGLIKPGAAARLGQQARELVLRWGIDLSRPAIAQAFDLGGDSATFRAWLIEFEKRLRESQLTTATDCLVELSTLCTDSVPVLLVECDDLPPLLHDCLARIAEPLGRADSPEHQAATRALRFPDERAEFREIARWCKEVAQSNPGTRIGVVIADLQGRRSTIDYYLRKAFGVLDDDFNRLPVNYSAGIALDRAPVVRDAIGLLELLGVRVSVNSLIRLLQSRFLELKDRDSPAMVEVIKRLREVGSADIETGVVRYIAAAAETDLGRYLVQLREHSARSATKAPSAWAQVFRDVLTASGWPGAGLDSLEFQQLGLWQDALQVFAGCDTLGPLLDADAAVRLLQQCCARQIFQPKTDDSNIQVLGPLEAAGLQFDALWIAGMHAGSWPAPARANPLLPVALQRQFDLPQSTSAHEWRFAEQLLRRYRASADTLIMSYAETENGLGLLPSPFLGSPGAGPEETPDDTPDDTPDVTPWTASDWLSVVQKNSLESLMDSRGPVLSSAEAETMRGGAGLLRAQSACPFQAFARFRLQAGAPDEPLCGLSAAERGNLLHAALRAVWLNLEEQGQLAALAAADLQTRCAEAAREGVASLPGARARHLGPAALLLETRRLAVLLEEWLRMEMERGEAFRVAAQEVDIKVQLGELTLKLRVDRVDSLAEGGELLIDYKSGRDNLSSLFGERPSQPQLPLYAYARGEDLVGVAYARVRTRDMGFVGIGGRSAGVGLATEPVKASRGVEGSDSWPSLRESWRERLLALASEVVDGESAVRPAKNACQFCDLKPLCRIGAAITREVQA